MSADPTTTVRAVRRSADGGLAAAEIPAPDPGPDEVVVAIEVVLLGADDLVGPGVTPATADGAVTVGREAVGIVRRVGVEVADWHPGDRVALPTTLPCGACGVCRAGRSAVCPTRRRPGIEVDGWAAGEVAVPGRDVHHVPPELADADAALVAGAVATAYHACKRAGIGPDVAVAVVGDDVLAAHLVQVAALAGGAVAAYADDAGARERALDLGAELALDPSQGPLADQLRRTTGDVADRVLLTGGDVDLAAAVAALRPGGRVVAVERPTTGARAVPLDRLVDDELDVVGATGSEAQDVIELFDLAAEGRLVTATTTGVTVDGPDVAAIVAAADDAVGRRIVVAFPH